jgi:iron(III) transport system substrate-binding protein
VTSTSPGDQIPSTVSRRAFIRRTLAAGLALPALGGLVAACTSAAPAPTPPPAATATTAKPAAAASPATAKPAAAGSPSPATTAPAAVKPAASANLDQLIEGAKKEGQLNWIDATIQQFNDPRFHDAFKKRYGLPDSFQINHAFKATGDLITQVQQEVQADKVTLDFVLIGDLTFWGGLDKAGALLDYAPSELGALDAQLKKLNFPTNPPRWSTIVSYAFAPVWNKKFVTKDIKSWFDVVDPAFKDKAIQGDIRTSSTQTDTYIGLRTVIGTEFFQKYADTVNPVLIFRTPEQQQKLTSGERVITDFHIAARALQAKRDDKSLDFGAAYPSEGVVPLPIQAGILAKAPHPNAAKLFVEFMTSQEGQQLFLDAEVQWPLRSDVTYADDVKQFLKPLDQIKIITLDWNTITPAARDEARAEFRRIFKVG